MQSKQVLEVDFTPNGPHDAAYIGFRVQGGMRALQLSDNAVVEPPLALLVDITFVESLSELGEVPMVVGQNFGNKALLVILNTGEYISLCSSIFEQLNAPNIDNALLPLSILERQAISYVVLDGPILNQPHLIMLARYCFFEDSWPVSVAETLKDIAQVPASTLPRAVPLDAAEYPYRDVITVKSQLDYRLERFKQEPEWRDDCDCEVCSARRIHFGAVQRDDILKSLSTAIKELADSYQRDSLSLGDVLEVTVKPTSAVTLRA